MLRKKYRDQSGLFLLEGTKTLRDAAAEGAAIERVFLDAEKYNELSENDGLIAQLDGKICVLDKKLYAQLSDTETSQGMIFSVRKPQPPRDLKTEVADGNLVVLDRLQDPGNIGTIIRTAEAAGYKGIIAIKGTADLYSPKAARAAAGSLLRMPVLTCDGAQRAAELLHELGKKITVTCLGDAANCFETDLTKDVALVVGNEGQGVSQDFMDLADIRVTIPMNGQIESLNAAVAAGILMYQSVGGNI
ncbi:MAG: RNA methyltransferase [Firmicutes bacterium]|nr:RNA methyltransferase [Bacillota bacterium]